MELPSPAPEPPTCTRLNNYGGYTTNMRGFLSYTPNLDKVDNPGMIPFLRNAYNITTTHKEFLSPMYKTGTESLPGVQVAQSGFTHTGGPATADYRSMERARKELVCGAYSCNPQIVPCNVAQSNLVTETKESFSGPAAGDSGSFQQPDVLVGVMESGFTRNVQPNPTDGRALDPVYAGQYPSFGSFGPSVTQIDFPPHTHTIRSGKEFTLPFSGKTERRSGFWQERGLPSCITKGAFKNYCLPGGDYKSTYQLNYPWRRCDDDFSGAVVTGKRKDPLAVMPTVNLFQGRGYYITETMESYADIPQQRTQSYPDNIAAQYNPSVFPKPNVCPAKLVDCSGSAESKSVCSGAATTPCTGKCVL